MLCYIQRVLFHAGYLIVVNLKVKRAEDSREDGSFSFCSFMIKKKKKDAVAHFRVRGNENMKINVTSTDAQNETGAMR